MRRTLIAGVIVAMSPMACGEEPATEAPTAQAAPAPRVVRPKLKLQLVRPVVAPTVEVPVADPPGPQPASSPMSHEEAEKATPTHRQTGLLKIDGGDLPKTKINCFATTAEGYLLAGCGTTKENGEVRVFDNDGNYVETWSSPVMVEAIGVRKSDGVVFLAGNGQLVKLDPSGSLMTQEQSPHAAVSKEQAEKIREEVVNRNQQMITTYERQIEVYQEQIDRTEKLITEMKTKLEELAEDAAAEDREQIESKLKTAEQRARQFANARDAWKDRVVALAKAEPSEEQIQQQIEAQVARKLAVASVSAVGETVYVACSSTVGYGYSVWKISDDLKQGEEIVTDLRGCCGQMDVQASDAGIFVAENSRHRVACFDADGKETASWGSSGEGPDAFSSCCNPMNVAFGTDGTVYTAESNTGRIKRYGTDGKLQQVIGSVDLVPGCKKVSIGVGASESRVYMLDITRNHVIVMEQIPSQEREEMIKQATVGEPGAPATEASAPQASAPPAVRLQINRARPAMRAVPAQQLKVEPKVESP